MTEVLFYHLQDRTLEQVLPSLLEKSLERGWRVVVQASSQERVEALDGHLWTYRDDSFLPHATLSGADLDDQPVLLTCDDSNPNQASVRFLVDGAVMPTDADGYARVVVIFNGDDDEARSRARGAWADTRARGFDATYWQTDENGHWRRQQ